MTSRRVPRAVAIITGDELLRGFIQDANSGFLADQLRDMGVELAEVRIVGDDFDSIGTAIADTTRGPLAADLIILSGGLGPTHDDRTSEAVALAVGRELVVDEAALELVDARVRAFGRMRTPEEVATFTPGNRKQASLPRGATWVDPLGTAPGYVLTSEELTFVVLPGPPPELRHAWKGVRATAELQAVLARTAAAHERLLRMWGIPESAASRTLDATGHDDSDARRVTICARDGEVEISVRGTDVASVDALVDGLTTEFGPAVFAVDDHRSVVEFIADELRARGWMLATCESCTGGQLGSALTEVAGSSAWYEGGLVTYSYASKTLLAGVPATLIASDGAVSESVARAMAEGVRATLGVDVGVGITGIAGPGGGTEAKPVGTVHLAVATPAGIVHRQIRVPGDRSTVRRRSSHVALHLLRESLRDA
ncbi:MAG: competence/damage-inducible protein cinA [Thermoleophilia bacterium]|nr:competence/damage-inducible protein cinA [Thermoleophilia bacterium]